MNEIPNPEGDTSDNTTHYLRTRVYSEDDPDAFYTYEYDNQRRLTKLTQYDNGLTIYSFSVIYNADTIKKIHTAEDFIGTQYYFPDCEGKITRALMNNDTVYYTYNSEGYMNSRITKTDSTTFEYEDGNMIQATRFSRSTKNQTGFTKYAYRSDIDKAHIMDPLITGLLQESFGKKSKNLIDSFSTPTQSITYTYTFDSNGLPIKIKGTRNNGAPHSYQVNEFESR